MYDLRLFAGESEVHDDQWINLDHIENITAGKDGTTLFHLKSGRVVAVFTRFSTIGVTIAAATKLDLSTP